MTHSHSFDAASLFFMQCVHHFATDVESNKRKLSWKIQRDKGREENIQKVE